ncbi:hypothetical protein SAMN06309944_0440 [Micrococcales bacterium KH10]|nr:hypothetical protein SAMN06309944_0440 [Micrococcales bacterium KH10]
MNAPSPSTSQASGASSPARSAEFDAFGPWVDEVKSPADVPRLYQGFPIEFAAAELILKIPRDIARRDANPTMDLYDNLIILESTQLTVLTRLPDSGYNTERVSLRDVVGVRRSVNLLDGRLIVYLSDERSLEIRFNGSATENIDRFVESIRRIAWAPIDDERTAASRAPAGSSTPALESAALGSAEEGLVNACRSVLRREPQLRVLAYQARRTLRSNQTGLARIIDLLRRRCVQGIIVCASDRELMVFTRAASITRKSIPEYSNARLVIPLERITEVRVTPHERYLAVSTVEIISAGTAIRLDVTTDSPAQSALQKLR